MKQILIHLFSAVLLGTSSSTIRSDMIFPGAAWEEATPESQGLNSEKLKKAIAHLEASTGRDGARELVIIRNGRMVWHGDNIDHVHGIWSCTKSFTSTVLGLLIEDGKCGLETRAASIAPSLQSHYPAVTLRHFATMTSGYRAVGDETTGSYTHGPSATPFTPHPQPLFEPGTAYAYWDSAMNQFAQALTCIAGEPLDTLFKRRIADPIGMNPNAWKWGDFGLVEGRRINGGSGNANKHIQISALELARFGHLWLNRGRWNNRQLIAESWIEAATAVQVPASLPNAWTKSEIDGPGQYGFNWWRNAPGPDGRMTWPGAPADLFAASGHNNNKLYGLPSWNMVIVRLGLDQADRKWTSQAQGEFLRLVGEAASAEKAPLELRAEQKPDRIIVYAGKDVFTEYRFLPTEKYPYFFPVNGPRTRQTVTTMLETNYPHHSSLFFGCDRVNGGNYWQEGLERGRIASKSVQVLEGQGKEIVINQDCSWERPGADSPFEDHRQIRIAAPSADLRLIDFDVTLTAKIKVKIEKSNHSLFSARMKPALSVLGGGTLINAQGDSREKGTFGKPSPWMDACGTHSGQVEGLAIFNHPENRWSPPPWFTRDYGFFSPTPMNWLEGGVDLAPGEKLRLRYRVVVHGGRLDQDALEAEYQHWIKPLK